MQLIDAVEETAKFAILRMHQIYLEDKLDLTEYVRMVKGVIEGAATFLEINHEIFASPGTMTTILREFARDIWVKSNQCQLGRDILEGCGCPSAESRDYDGFFFEHVYTRGVYPL